MRKILKCRDIGTACPFEIQGTNEEILLRFPEHAVSEHPELKTSHPEVLDKIKRNIKNLPPENWTS